MGVDPLPFHFVQGGVKGNNVPLYDLIFFKFLYR
jgi:hypothetical protein